MSLSLAIDQIRRPTWWYEGNKPAPVKGGSIHPETTAMRSKILYWIKSRGRKVSGTEVATHFELSTERMWHYVNQMAESGLIRKMKPRHDRSLLEAV